MDLSLLNLMCGRLGFSCMKLLHMERFLIQVCVCSFTLYFYFGAKRQRKYSRKEMASDSSDTDDWKNVLQVILML